MIMKKEMKAAAVLALASAAIMLAGCKVEEESSLFSHEPGTPIVFGVSSEWESGTGTRTEYSGKDQDNNNVNKETSEYERIDWVPESDQIRILCEAAVGSSTDYKIETATADGRLSKATASPIEGEGLFWGTGDHYFYAMYPVPGMESNYGFTDNTVSASNARITASNNQATITGVVPATQEAVKVGNIYKANMNYAYMYAAKKVGAGDHGSVELSFRPLVTTLEFRLKGNSSLPIGVNLTKLELSSASSPLTGTFTATVTESGVDPATDITVPAFAAGTNDKITIILPTEEGATTPGIELTDTPVTFTFLTLPTDQTDLTLTLYFGADYAGTRSLKLTDSTWETTENPEGWITVDACKKVYITPAGVPGGEWEYFLGNLSDVKVGPPGGSDVFGAGFVSYKTNGFVSVPVRFRLRFYTLEDGWKYTPPEWLELDVDYNGSVDGQDLRATFVPQVNSASQIHHEILADASRAKTDFDLSTYNVATGTEGINRTTANCYVVRGAGTYKLPLVYGNGVLDGQVNESAFHAKYRSSDPSYIGDNVTDYLGHFKDHLDHNITTPYIAEQLAGKTLTAALVWTDSKGLVTDVALSGSGRNAYLTFSVPAETIDQGNALVAVLADGKIAWSWHIWVTEDMGQPQPGFNGYTFSPLNLGWVEGKHIKYEERLCWVYAYQYESGQTTSADQHYLWQTGDEFNSGPTNPFYQWGRKDPLWQADGKIAEGEAFNEYPDYKIYYPGAGFDLEPKVENMAVSIGTAIQNPYVVYHEDSSSSTVAPIWCTTNQLNNWNSVYAGQRYQDYNDPVTKTIYDPSPVGYVLPNHDVFKDLSTSNLIWDSTKKGRYYVDNTDLFFHAAGYLVDRGWLSEYAKTANYWSAIPCTNWSDWLYWGLGISFNDTSVSGWQLLHRRATGLSICPVIDTAVGTSATGGMGASTGGMDGHKYDVNGGWR